MKNDSRLSAVLHALLHMADHDGPLTSEHLALCMRTNPVVVRRTMGLLRKAGLVTSAKGHAGGWTIAVPLARISMRQLYEALGAPRVFAIGNRSANPACLVEQSVNTVMDAAFDEAEALLMQRFEAVTVADLAGEFSRRHRKGKHET